MAMDKAEAEKFIKNAKKDEVLEALVQGEKAEERNKSIAQRGRSDKRKLAGMAAEFGGAAVGGAAVGALKAYGHEEALIPVAGALTIVGAYMRIKKNDDEVGEGLFAAGSGMTAALIAVETESYLKKSA